MNRLNKFVEQLNLISPGIEIKFKNESIFMKILGFVLFFIPNFMNLFVTTIGKTIYLPSRDWLLKSEEELLPMIAHEYVHIRDRDKFGIWFSIIYLFPIIIIPLVLLSSIILSWLWVILLLLICLAPIPSPGRAYFEFRGYTMSIFVFKFLSDEKNKNTAVTTINILNAVGTFNKYFTDFSYYVMWPFGVRSKLLNKASLIVNGTITDEDVIYNEVTSALKISKEV